MSVDKSDKERLIFDPDKPEIAEEISSRIEESEALGMELLARASEDGELIDLYGVEPTFEAAHEFYMPVMEREWQRIENEKERRRKITERAQQRPPRRHPRKDEALAALETKLQNSPWLSVSNACTRVVSEMDDGAPTAETLRKWHRQQKKVGTQDI